MRYVSVILMLLTIAATCRADEEVLQEGAKIDTVEVVLKSGRIVQGKMIQETTSTILLQVGSSRAEFSKINIKTINGRPAFQPLAASSPDGIQSEEILIPAGPYLMGDSQDKDNVVHKVHLNAYWIDNFEVTNARYGQFIEATGYSKPLYRDDPRYNGDNQPVVGVTWEDAQAYCAWAKKRLPTEAEWEKAARGEKSRLFPWGDVYNTTCANTKVSKHKRPLSVGSYPKGRSPYGVHDLSGNVWEWCQDWYDKVYYPSSPTRNPTGAESGKKRIIRGGGWNAEYVDMAHRRGIKPTEAYPSLGFRCARNP